MASVNGYTAERMKEIEDSAIIDGSVVGGDLILERFDGTTINAGSVIGPTGPTGTVPSVARSRVTFGVGVTQSFPNLSVAAVDWPDEETDTLGFHSTVTNTSRFTVPTGYAGVYAVSYSLYWDGMSGGIASAWMQKSASSIRYGFASCGNVVTHGVALAGTETLPLSVGDYVEVFGYQNSGSTMTCGKNLSGFSITRIGPI